jgi:outer membrane protein TolC
MHAAVGAALLALGQQAALSQEQVTAPRPLPETSGAPPVPYSRPAPDALDKPLPINLPTALRLANATPIDIAVASQRIRLAVAQLDRAQVLWLPTLYLGVDYYRHDGPIQDTTGAIIRDSRQSFIAGAGPSMVFALADAIFEPLAARQVVQARETTLQAARNDSLLNVAEAYFNVQQALGELAGAVEAARRAEELYRIVEDRKAYLPAVELARTQAEVASRRQAVQSFRERWRTASADLVHILRLDPTVLVQPLEPPHLRVTLVSADQPIDDLIPLALTNRPELASQQALVQTTLQRLRQERLRPLVPSVLLRGASTGVFGTLGWGYFGGGRNDQLSSFGSRSDFDVQLLWELQNLGFGNRARVNERRAENQLAVLELFRIQDRVAAEVAQALAQAKSAAGRLQDAESELKFATVSLKQNLEGVKEFKRLQGNIYLLVIRPQEVIAAIQALTQAYNHYFAAVADYDRAQFRLYHALGHPAQIVAGEGNSCPGPAVDCLTPEPDPVSTQKTGRHFAPVPD